MTGSIPCKFCGQLIHPRGMAFHRNSYNCSARAVSSIPCTLCGLMIHPQGMASHRNSYNCNVHSNRRRLKALGMAPISLKQATLLRKLGISTEHHQTKWTSCGWSSKPTYEAWAKEDMAELSALCRITTTTLKKSAALMRLCLADPARLVAIRLAGNKVKVDLVVSVAAEANLPLSIVGKETHDRMTAPKEKEDT